MRSHIVLDRERVTWREDGGALNRGGFAKVFAGTYDGNHVAIKQLDMAAFVGASEQEVRDYAEIIELHLGASRIQATNMLGPLKGLHTNVSSPEKVFEA